MQVYSTHKLKQDKPVSTLVEISQSYSLSHQSNNVSQLNGAINQDLKQADKWLNGNKRSLNVMKTMCIFPKPKYKALESNNKSLKLKIQGSEKLNILVGSLTTPWIERDTLRQFCPRSQKQLAC